MESKIITLKVKRPKSQEELKAERQKRVIVGLSVVAVLLAIEVCILLLALSFTAATQATQEQPEQVASITAVTPPAAQPLVYMESVQTPVKALTETLEPEIDQEELELLALVIYQEAGGDACSDEARRMVAEVALNRVADGRFPDTLEGVLLQEGQYGRLSWTGIRWPDRAELPQEANAVARAYRIAEEVLTTTERLLPEDTIFQSEYQQGTEVVAYVDGIYFCR